MTQNRLHVCDINVYRGDILQTIMSWARVAHKVHFSVKSTINIRYETSYILLKESRGQRENRISSKKWVLRRK